MEKLGDKAEDMMGDLEDILEDFCEAAEKAGIDEDDIEEILGGIEF